MGRAARRDQLLLGSAVFLGVYLGFNTLIAMANNGWYPFLTAEFCGSLADFTDNPVPEVCLPFWAYWYRTALHPPYALVGVILAGVIATGVAFRAALEAKLIS